MKVSKYNFFYPYEKDENQMIAYNALSNSLALMDKSKYDEYTSFYKENREIKDEKLKNDLINASFILEDEIDELDLIRYRMQKNRFNTSALTLTIAVTADCNFRCTYCYEKEVLNPVYMSDDIQERIITIIENQSKHINMLHITWYGGEPLLAVNVIENISKRALEICEKNEISYSSQVVTNGYFLNKQNIEILNALQVNHIQVTLDGTEKIHDKRRPFKDGSGTYSTIINNLKENYEILPTISLRVNTDRTNMLSSQEINDLILTLGLEKKVFPYIGKVNDDNNCCTKSDCLSMKEFSIADLEYTMSLVNQIGATSRYPNSVSNYCGADRYNSFIIGADGNCYRCWSDIGNIKKCVGSINDDKVKPNKTYLDYLMFDPTKDTSCSKCNLLPICMGGCPFRRVSHDEDRCSTYKYALKEYLTYIADNINKDRQSSCNCN